MGLPLRKFLSETSHREYQTIKAWYDEEMNNPSRSDHYLMQIAQMVHGHDRKKVLKLEEFKLKFGPSVPKKKVFTAEDRNKATAIAKARWRARMNRKGE